jgi:transcriptional regulator with XRE-family HTH domain
VTLPECVNAWLEATGKKQNAVAKDAGLKPSQVSEIAAGKINPRWSAVEKLAKGFGVSPAKFLAGPPRPEKATGHERLGGERNPILSDRFAVLLSALDVETPAEDSWRGDVLKAVAALNRALRRPDPAVAEGGARKAGR